MSTTLIGCATDGCKGVCGAMRNGSPFKLCYKCAKQARTLPNFEEGDTILTAKPFNPFHAEPPAQVCASTNCSNTTLPMKSNPAKRYKHCTTCGDNLQAVFAMRNAVTQLEKAKSSILDMDTSILDVSIVREMLDKTRGLVQGLEFFLDSIPTEPDAKRVRFN